MKITNKQFVERFLSELPAGQVVTLLTVIKTLLVRHQLGALRQTTDAKGDVADVIGFVDILQKRGKCNRADVAALIRLLESHGGTTKHYAVTSNNDAVAERIHTRVSQHASAEFDAEHGKEIGLMVHGDNRIYKRTLKTDLQKLLNN